MSTEKEQQTTENESNESADELLELKKELADEVAEKLIEKDSNIFSLFFKGSISDYLIDENTINDALHDEVLLGGLGKSIGIINPIFKKYREKFSEIRTKTDLKNLKNTIFDEISKENINQSETKTGNNPTDTTSSTQPSKSGSTSSEQTNESQSKPSTQPSESGSTSEKAKVDTKSESYEIDHINFTIPSESKNVHDNLKGKEKPDLEPFACALKIYNSLKSQGKLKNTKYLTVVDFTKKKSKNRMFVINTENRTVEHAVKCGHGTGSGTGEYAKSFGNILRSHKSSLGGYITPDKITKTTRPSGWYGLRSIKGIESSNSAAAGRGIAIHPGGLNSDGCFSIPRKVSSEIMNKQIGGSFLFAYAKSKQYFAQSNYFKQDSNGNYLA